VDAHIRLSGGDEVEEITDLWEWLANERALAGMVTPVRRPPGDSELGGVVELLEVVAGSGGVGVVLARSLLAWLGTRRASVSVTIETSAGSVKVVAGNLRTDDVLPLVEGILRDGIA
jgi:hypothetical protein